MGAAPPDEAAAYGLAVPPGPCPPSGAVGWSPGEVADDVALLDCGFGEVWLRDLCDGPVYLYAYSGGREESVLFARDDANDLNARFSGRGLSMFLVVSGTADGSPPDGGTCRRVRALHRLRMPVLFDPGSVVHDRLGMATSGGHLVLQAGNVVSFNGAGDAEAVVPALRRVMSSYESEPDLR